MIKVITDSRCGNYAANLLCSADRLF